MNSGDDMAVGVGAPAHLANDSAGGMRRVAKGNAEAASQGPDAFRLDRPSIRTSFDRASASYEAAAVLHARVNEVLMSRLELFNFQPQVVVDLGTGTGQGAEELQRCFRCVLVVGF